MCTLSSLFFLPNNFFKFFNRKRIICTAKLCNKNVGHHARLRENEHLFRCRAYLEGNVLRYVCGRAHLRALMTQKSCAVGMRNAILRNHLKTLKTNKVIGLDKISSRLKDSAESIAPVLTLVYFQPFGNKAK